MNQQPTVFDNTQGLMINLSLGTRQSPQATDEINIGVGELQECTVSKSMDF